jgi:hypothetical protein
LADCGSKKNKKQECGQKEIPGIHSIILKFIQGNEFRPVLSPDK